MNLLVTLDIKTMEISMLRLVLQTLLKGGLRSSKEFPYWDIVSSEFCFSEDKKRKSITDAGSILATAHYLIPLEQIALSFINRKNGM